MDYKKLGFKSGIEIHQQLDTNKLFCNCPCLVNDPSKPDVTIRRKLRPVVGETGEIDAAALHEMKKDKTFIYEACRTSSCLVELDEEPPHPINQASVEVCLKVALLLNAKIVDEIQVMRKTVIDGSNTSGFQRTALVARNGYIETSKGKVRIPTISLEEEAAKKITQDENTVTYRLDRLGVPLIEIGTDPDIIDPAHAKEVAEKLGMILRSVPGVKRGIGTIRQDVNVSIKGKPRVEIKGFQDLRYIEKVIIREVERQQKEKYQAQVRKANADGTTTFIRPMPGSSRMYPETDVVPLVVNTENIKLPELLSDKINSLQKKYKLNEARAREIVKHAIDFESLVKDYQNIKPDQIANIILETPKEIKKRLNIDTSTLTNTNFEEVLEKLNNRTIPKDTVIEILSQLAQGKSIDYSKFKSADDSEIEKTIKAVVEKNIGAPFGALMGECMKELHGKTDGKKVSNILKKFV